MGVATISDAAASFASAGVDCQAFHYRTGGGAEVNLVLEDEFGVVPVVIKHAEHGDTRSVPPYAIL